MSGYDGVVGGKLKLKGKALDIKAGGVKKKKKNKRQQELITQVTDNELSADAEAEAEAEAGESGNADDHEDVNDRSSAERKGSAANDDDNNLTPAEKRYIEQRAQIDVKRMAREANKSHRDRIQDFNQYLANMSEHYDIPKVGPG